jgi:hypothetical protein
MPTLEQLEARVRALEDLEALRLLKYKYWRCLDLKRWDELGECFTADATVDYGGGKYRFEGRDAILRFLRESLGVQTGAVGVHHGHQPELALTGPDTATGRWALYNYMFNERQNRCLRIGAFYEDDYVRVDGAWKIKRTGYTLLFHEEWKRDETPSLHLIGP